jgi:AcrR family transcriptional regulator
MAEVAMETLDRYQVRSQKTLRRILEAAEEVFVRNGFESAQMDEIAARAERSKGAVYLHFKSKEDLFLALIEHRIRAYSERHQDDMRKCATREQRVDAFRKLYEGLANDRAYHVLTLEFKLFALRRPEWKERYQKTFEALRATNSETTFEQMFGKRSRLEREHLEASSFALGPLANGLMLESYFEPDILGEKVIGRLLKKIFNALIPTD